MLCTATQIFHVQAKISTVRTVFPDYLSVSYDYGMTEHGHSFLKSIILSYELHSSFRHSILILEKLRQPVTKYIAPPPTSSNVDGSANYTEHMLQTNYYWTATLMQGRDRGRGFNEAIFQFLRENLNKPCFIELSQNFCDRLQVSTHQI